MSRSICAPILVLATFITVSASTWTAGHAEAPDSTDIETRRQVARLLADYRRQRDNPVRQAETIIELAEVDSEAVDRLLPSLDRQIERAQALVDAEATPPELDAKIEEHREVLRKLREDGNLTKEKIERYGAPALNSLNELYRLWWAKNEEHLRELEKARGRLEQLATFYGELDKAFSGEGDPPLPASDRLRTISDLLAKTEPSDEDKLIKQVHAKNVEVAADMHPQIVEGFRLMNEMRLMCGLNPLVIDPKLCEAATGHSADMERLNFFDHTSPVKGKKSFTDRARAAGTSASGENIYMGSTAGQTAIKAWFYSPGHHKNMLGNHSRQGLGRSGKYWTQMFGR